MIHSHQRRFQIRVVAASWEAAKKIGSSLLNAILDIGSDPSLRPSLERLSLAVLPSLL